MLAGLLEQSDNNYKGSSQNCFLPNSLMESFTGASGHNYQIQSFIIFTIILFYCGRRFKLLKVSRINYASLRPYEMIFRDKIGPQLAGLSIVCFKIYIHIFFIYFFNFYSQS